MSATEYQVGCGVRGCDATATAPVGHMPTGWAVVPVDDDGDARCAYLCPACLPAYDENQRAWIDAMEAAE